MDCRLFETMEHNKIQYYVAGNGNNIIVMLHAQGTSSESFFDVVKELAKNNKVILVDYYGHGRSTHKSELYKIDVIGNDIYSLLRSVTKEKITLIGHSSGGLIAAYIESKYHICIKLILEDAPFFSSYGERRYKTFNYVDLSSICHNFLNQTQEKDFPLYYFEHQYAWNFFPEKNREKIRTKLTANAKKYRSKHPDKPLKVIFWPKSALEAFRGMNAYDPLFGESFYTNSFHEHIKYEVFLKDIKCPAVFLKAKTNIDNNGMIMCALTDEDVEKLAALIPDFTTIYFDCGHGIHIEKKKEFIRMF